ncbi:aldehyde ferredoxin oxidoreductase family protein [Staphylothermus hellenicus]|nr:aldehyde ferredoxin oxidoreductase family protein [Staphylothermus hellenicus]
MSRLYMWGGTILIVDLSREKIVKKPLEREIAVQYLGGRGLNDYMLYKYVPAGIDPLGPENIIALGNGALAGTVMPFTSRLHISTLSSLTGILGDGNAGGDFAAKMKHAGYDQIIITGKASKPVYVWIDDDHAEIRSAEHLWGLTFGETVDALRDEHGDDITVAGIGPAGEHLVRPASTMVDKFHSGARGSGAVWGSKYLKAIALRGTKGVEVYDPEKLYEYAKMDIEYFKKNEFIKKIYSVIGTHYGMLQWYPGWKYYEKYLGPEEIPVGLRPQDLARYEIGRTSCYSCPIGCKDVYRTEEIQGYSTEFESVFALGTNLGITDTETFYKLEHMCDEYGMDVITVGDTLALATFLYQKGIITDEDTGGIKLQWGDGETYAKLVEMMAYRKGFGAKLAEGYRNFAKLFGDKALQYSYDVKGLGRGWYHVDFLNGVFTLSHATSTRGADHLRGRSWAYWENDRNMDPELPKKLLSNGLPDYRKDPVGAVIVSENACAMADSIGRCKGSINLWPQAVPLSWKWPLFKGLAKVLTAASGIEFTEEMINTIAERIYILEIAFNVKQGIKRKHYRLPLPPEILNTEKGRQELEKHNKMVDEYLERRGCDPKTGVPKKETLQRLGLDYVIEDMEKEYPEWDGPPLYI